VNDLTVSGGSVEVLDRDPPAGEDPVLDRAIVGGYLRDGQLNVSGGIVSSPRITLGVSAGKIGTYAQSGGNVSTRTLRLGSAAGGIGVATLTGGQLHVDDLLFVAPTSSLAITGGSAVDMADGAAIFDYSGTSPLAMVRGYILNGYNGGSWNGTGMNSSAAAAAAATGHRSALGYAEAASIGLGTGSFFGGQTLADSTALLVRYTYAGDGDLSGNVDLTDFTYLAANFNGTGKNWLEGDYDYDGTVNLTDFTFLASNFNQSLGAGEAADLGSRVPDPAGLSVLFAAPIIMNRRRRRARR
jgi:hypothetical protein